MESTVRILSKGKRQHSLGPLSVSCQDMLHLGEECLEKRRTLHVFTSATVSCTLRSLKEVEKNKERNKEEKEGKKEKKMKKESERERHMRKYTKTL